jgi:hypothetical protein
MKNVFLVFLVFLGSVALASPNVSIVKTPPEMLSAIAKTEQLSESVIQPVQGGTVGWGGGFIVALMFVDTMKTCGIYFYVNGVDTFSFGDAPCEFQSGAVISTQRKSEIPDVIYHVSQMIPTRGVMGQELKAFFYDNNKLVFCASDNLSRWYSPYSNKSKLPDLSDAVCPDQYF